MTLVTGAEIQDALIKIIVRIFLNIHKLLGRSFMTIGIWILGDRLNLNQAALQSCQELKSQTPIIIIESLKHVRDRLYHKQKLVLVWSAMRHFAAELEQAGWQVKYAIADDFQAPLYRSGLKSEKYHRVTSNKSSQIDLFGKLIAALDLPCSARTNSRQSFSLE